MKNAFVFHFFVTYYGKPICYNIKANSKQEAIDKGYMKACKQYNAINCEFNYKGCQLIGRCRL